MHSRVFGITILAINCLFLLAAVLTASRGLRAAERWERRQATLAALVATIILGTLFCRERWILISSQFAAKTLSSIGPLVLGLGLSAIVFYAVFLCIAFAARSELLKAGISDFWIVDQKGKKGGNLILVLLGTTACLGYIFSLYSAIGNIGILERNTDPFGWMILQCIATGFCEELYFRGYLQSFLLRQFSSLYNSKAGAISILLASVVFAASHFGGFLRFAEVFPLGIFLGFAARRWGLIYAAGAHTVIDIAINLWVPNAS
jgi:membrane protease YdiL (CAAX protease family)